MYGSTMVYSCLGIQKSRLAMSMAGIETLFHISSATSSGGLAGYDVCLTRIRSRVRAPPGVLFFFSRLFATYLRLIIVFFLSHIFFACSIKPGQGEKKQGHVYTAVQESYTIIKLTGKNIQGKLRLLVREKNNPTAATPGCELLYT